MKFVAIQYDAAAEEMFGGAVQPYNGGQVEPHSGSTSTASFGMVAVSPSSTFFPSSPSMFGADTAPYGSPSAS